MILKIVYQACCGIDVHKTFVIACVTSTNSKGVTFYKSHRFSTFTKGLNELSHWLLLLNCKDVYMEYLVNYGSPFSISLNLHVLLSSFILNMLKAIRGKKIDKKDAKYITDLFKHDLFAASFMPPLPIRQLRDLMHYRYKLTNFASIKRNRLHNSLAVSNIQLTSIVSEVFSKNSMNIIDKILEYPVDSSFDSAPLIHGSMRKMLVDLQLAVNGFISHEQSEKWKIIKRHYLDISSRKSDLEATILSLIELCLKEINFILFVPFLKTSSLPFVWFLRLVSLWDS